MWTVRKLNGEKDIFLDDISMPWHLPSSVSLAVSSPCCDLGTNILPCSEWVSESLSVVSNSLWPHGLYSPWNSPGQNAGVGSLSLLQGIFPTQGLNPSLPHCRQILYQLSHQGSPRILEWVAYPLSSRSSWLRNRLGSSALQEDSLPTEL